MFLPEENDDGGPAVPQGGAGDWPDSSRTRSGAPIAGAILRVTSSSHREVVEQSHDDGRFTVWVEQGLVLVTAEAVGYASARASTVAPSHDLVLRLTPGSTLEGHVVAEPEGKPVAGVEVRAVPALYRDVRTPPAGTSQADGAFTIQGVAPGTYKLIAEGPGWRGESVGPLRVGIAEIRGGIRVTVSAAVLVSGRVVQRAGGGPCAQGTLALGPTGTRSLDDPPSASEEAGRSAVPAITTTLAPDGTARFQAVPQGTYHVVVHCAEHVLISGPTTLDVRQSNVGDLLWTVDSGLGLVVHVVDEADHPLPGVPFRVFWPAPALAQNSSTPNLRPVTDPDGRFEVRNSLYPGTYTLAPDNGYEGNAVAVELREGMGTSDATLRLRGQASVLVTVQTPKGDPVDAVTVVAEAMAQPSQSTGTPTPDGARAPAPAPLPATTMRPASLGPSKVIGVPLGQGRFRIAPLAAGRYLVQVSDESNALDPEGAANESVEVASGSVAATTIVWDRSASIRGRIVDASGQPVADAWVDASCRAGGAEPAGAAFASRPQKRGVSDAEGGFTVSGLEPRVACRLRVEEPSGAVTVKEDVPSGDDHLVIALQAPGGLRGTAVNESGNPMDGRFTLSLGASGTGVARADTVLSVGGRWTLSDVPPGQWHIQAIDENGAVAQTQAELTQGQTLDGVRLQFRTTRTSGQDQSAARENAPAAP